MYSGVTPDEDLMIKDLLLGKKINLSKISKVDVFFFLYTNLSTNIYLLCIRSLVLRDSHNI
jgi:hypothetical protein